MTVEERLAAAEAENATLKANQSQNQSFITQLQGEIKALKEAKTAQAAQPVAPKPIPVAPAPRPTAPINKPYEEFQKRKWREAVIKDTLELIPVNPAHRNTMHEEVRAYCLENMTDDTTTNKYVKAVFEMLYGRALLNPNHVIHTVPIVNAVNPATPVVPTTEPVVPVAPAPVAPTLQEFSNNFPPTPGQVGEQVMNPAVPQPEVTKIPSVASAMAILKEKL